MLQPSYRQYNTRCYGFQSVGIGLISPPRPLSMMTDGDRASRKQPEGLRRNPRLLPRPGNQPESVQARGDTVVRKAARSQRLVRGCPAPNPCPGFRTEHTEPRGTSTCDLQVMSYVERTMNNYSEPRVLAQFPTLADPAGRAPLRTICRDCAAVFGLALPHGVQRAAI